MSTLHNAFGAIALESTLQQLKTAAESLLSVVQTLEKNGITDAQIRATPLAVSANNLDIRDLVFAQDKVDASGSTILQGTPQWNTIDKFTTGYVLGAQSAPVDSVLTFTFTTPVDLVYIFSADHNNHVGMADPFGGTPSDTLGIPLLPGVPQSFPVVTSSVKVYESAGGVVYVWGYKY